MADTPAPSPVNTPTVFQTVEEALRAEGALLERFAKEQPGALVALLAAVLACALCLLGVPMGVLVCLWRRRHSQQAYESLSAGERLAVRSPEDMHVALDDSSDEELQDMSKDKPRKEGGPRLPRLAIPPAGRSLDAAELHMTPRTKAAILGTWTPRKS
jgi:hypothetical protein